MENQINKPILDEFSKIKTYNVKQCKDEITKLISGYDEGVLLWIVQHFFHTFHMKGLIPAHINPVNILYTRNIVKKTPPGSYSKVVMMLSYQQDKSKDAYLETALFLFHSCYELLRTAEF